jgi:hypothetical protein
MARNIYAITFIVGSSLVGGTALAQDQDVVKGFYAGGAITQARFDDDNFSLADVDDEDNSWKVIGGYRFHENFGAELSYVDFGELSAQQLTGTGSFSAEAKGLTAFAVGFIPVPYVDLFAKIGVAKIDAKTRGLVTNFDDNTTEFAYGAGAQWRWRNLAVRAEYEKFDTDIIGDLDLISLGATYTFNLAR